MKLTKVILEIVVSLAAIWGAGLSSYAYFHEQSASQPILTTVIEMRAKKSDDIVEYAKLTLFVSNTGGTPIELKANPSIQLINAKTGVERRFVLSSVPDKGKKDDGIQLPILLRPGNVAAYNTAFYPIENIIDPLNGYAVILQSSDVNFVSYTPHPQNVKGIMALMHNPTTQKNFDSIKTYPVRAYAQ